jgi:hypothetical protein
LDGPLLGVLPLSTYQGFMGALVTWTSRLDWSILAMAVAELFALKEQLAKRPRKGGVSRKPVDPIKRSLAQTMRALRGCLAKLGETPEPGKDLAGQLREAVTDSYERQASKKARYRPANPDKKPLGDPKVRRFTKEEKKRLKRAEMEKTE